eukprot:6114206-Pyramimonas_sp.AAC.2
MKKIINYHHPTTSKDDWGGWDGPFPVVRNDPERSQVIIRVGSRDVQFKPREEIGSDNTALRAVLTFVASLPAGRPAMTCGDAPTKKGVLDMTSASRLSPKVHLALQYLIIIFFRIENVVPVRFAKRIHKRPPLDYADSCTLVH